MSAIAIYNKQEQKLIAIIDGHTLAGKWIFGKYKKAYSLICSNIHSAIKYKSVIKAEKNDLGFPIAIRNANKEQIELLGERVFVLLDDNIKRIENNLHQTITASEYFYHDLREKSKIPHPKGSVKIATDKRRKLWK